MYALILSFLVAGNPVAVHVDTYASLGDCVETMYENRASNVFSCELIREE
jgi:hypothetical protein